MVLVNFLLVFKTAVIGSAGIDLDFLGEVDREQATQHSSRAAVGIQQL